MSKYTSTTPLVIDGSWYRRPEGFRERVAAGGVVARVEDGKVLVALIGEGEWTSAVLPKGGVDEGEDLETAARREIEEEAGFTELHLLQKLGVGQRQNYEKEYWSVTHYFLFATTQIDVKPTDVQAHSHSPDWFDLDNLPAMLWPEQRALLQTRRAAMVEAVSKYFELPPKAE